ncbi:alginate lyase family protein [Luteimonas sp. M1R5S18]|jgi:hypothetical protein|uniref:Alginate lyase family protein n=1 Tax=Luteimonas rhizosphaericola TaxID=3042024 RepID=A0ABT6JMB7_9GAMM|nr:alginate lyase family protein [Luteimonas rhizosphaericola]MDH5831829.1 alginate lyase family protein [Luteimonas rhizosphaericola]
MDGVPAIEMEDFASIIAKGYDEQAASGFRPRSDLPAHPIAVPLDWDMDPFQDRNWSFQLHAWRMLPRIWGRYFSSERDSRYLREAMGFIVDWHRFHYVEGRTSRFGWYDMAAGLRAMHLAMVLCLVEDGQADLTDEERVALDVLVQAHLDALRDKSFISEGNHGVFQMHGLQLLSIASGHFARDNAYTSETLRELLRAQFTSQAVHTENSPYYHLFGIRLFSGIRPGLFPDVAEDIAATLARAKELSAWLSFPDGTILNVGDSEGKGVPMPRARQLAAEFVGKTGRQYASVDLAASGYCVVRTVPGTPAARARALYVVGSHHIDSHSHADELSFVYFHDGAPLFIDSGKYSYNKDRLREYFVSDHAHNLLVLEDRPHAPSGTRLRGSALTHFRPEESGYRIKGVVRRGSDFRHSRTIVYQPDARIAIRDHVETPDRSKRVTLFHLAEDAEAVAREAHVDILRKGRVVARIRPRGTPERIEVVRGVETPHEFQGWFSPRYRQKVPASVVKIVYPPEQSLIWTAITF